MLYLDNLGNTHISPTPYQNTALLTLTATNLSENTNYSAFISAQNTAGESALSSAENFKTWQEVIFYASNKTTRSYVYKTNYAKSFDTKLTAQTTYLEAQFTIGAISPNGRYFSYDADVTTTNNAIMLYDFELNTVTTLVNDGNINRYPVWKPDDPDHVYFTENTGVVVLKKVNINTLTVTSLRTFSGTNESCRYIRFTPDSSRLYIQYQATTTTIQSIAWIDTSDYNGSLNIIFSNSTNGILEFNINKAGTKICFSAVTGANQQLFDMNLDGSSLTQRTTGANNKSCPIYSPDDSKILFRLVIGSDSIIYQCDNTYDGITGYFENQAVWLNNTGNLTEFPLAWGTISSLALSVPQNLTVTNTTIDSASFEWDLVTGASRYKLYIGLLPNQGDLLPSYNGLDIGNVDNFTTSNDLPPGQTLYVSVKAVNNYTESDFSSEQTFTI
jgi:Tol biopolymer transport system component